MLLLKLSLQKKPSVLAKKLAEDLFLSPSEISESVRRCKASGLLYWTDLEKRVNRAALAEFLVHGFRYMFPAERGSITRGIPTSFAAEPLKHYFLGDSDPPPVWPYVEGMVRGTSLKPLHRRAPEASLRDPALYELLALADGVRGERVRERKLASEELAKRLRSDE